MKVFLQNHKFLHFICLVFFLFYGFYISHQWAPLLFKLRPYSFWFFSGLAAILAVFLIVFRRHFSKEVSIFYIYITAFFLTFSSFQEWVFHLKKERILQSKSSVLKEVGAHIILGFTDWKEVGLLSEKGLIAGVFITSRNVKSLSKLDLKEKIDQLQEGRKKIGLPKLFICTDQEGGMVSRLSPPLLLQRTLREELENELDPMKRKESILNYTKIQAEELKSVGVNVNFSPVLDLPVSDNPAKQLHTQIELRSIGKDFTSIAETASTYSLVLMENGIVPTNKHFPGIGKIDVDTHFLTGKHKANWEELKVTDMKPFIDILEKKPKSWVMLSHTKILDIDEDYPISFSKKVIQKIRQEIDSDLILISDDFSMGPTYYFGIDEAGEKALSGGLDFLLISYDKDLIYPFLHNFLENSNSELINTLKLSKMRIQRYQ